MAAPILKVRLTGDDVTNDDVDYTWTPNEKSEITLSLVASDGYQSIDFSDINSIRMILLKSTSAFSILFTVGSEDITFSVRDIMMFSPSAAFMESLTYFGIRASTETAQKIEVRLYGAS